MTRLRHRLGAELAHRIPAESALQQIDTASVYQLRTPTLDDYMGPISGQVIQELCPRQICTVQEIEV